MKLSIHSQEDSVWGAFGLMDSVASRLGYMAGLDLPGPAARKIHALGIRFVARRYSSYDFNPDHAKHQISMGITPQAAAREFLEDCIQKGTELGWWQYAWGIMTPPAMATPGNDAHIMSWVIDWQTAFVEYAGQYGKEAIVCNVPTGNDGFHIPNATYYGCQEYGWPNILSQQGDHALRYRSWFPREVLSRNPNAKLFILECGVTGVLSPSEVQAAPDAPHGKDVGYKGGYGIPGISADEYWHDSLLRYNWELEKDPYVLSAMIFGDGMNADWATHDIAGTETEEYLKQSYLSNGGPNMGRELIQEYPDLWEAWLDSGGIDNFEAFLVAIGQRQVSPAKHRELVKNRLESAVKENVIFLDSLPL